MTVSRYLLRHWALSLVLFASLASYASVFIPPDDFWPAVFLSYAIPVFMITNCILFVVTIRRSELRILPAIGALAGLAFLPVSVSVHSAPDNERGFSVLSLNAKFFRKAKTYHEFSGEMIQWAVKDTSAIKCFQEYSTNSQWEPLDVTGQMVRSGYKGYAVKILKGQDHNLGLAIFTKFDVLDSGVVWEDETSSNGTIYADLKAGKDTMRVYNVHLRSMSLDIYQYKSPEYYGYKVKKLGSKLMYGARTRSEQIDELIRHASACPYPFLICGDFNETPYSYNYFKLRSKFSNAFEKAGHGFGFTVNGTLFFLRIDHHFFGNGIKALDFSVDRTMKISDHFATRGTYRVGS